jgi:hypothetical protein
MTSRAQKQAILQEFRDGKRAIPAGRFERYNSHLRVRCVFCHASGFGPLQPTPWDASPWQVPCLLNHPTDCRCGLSFHSPGHLAQHVKADRWPSRALDHGAA